MTTAFEFACPSCAAPGKARVDWAGRSVRCKHCKAVFVLPTPGEAAADSYDLAEPVAAAPGPIAPAPLGGEGASTFTASYRDAPLPDVRRDRPRPKREVEPAERMQELRGDARVRMLAGLAVAGAVLAALAFAVPGLGMPLGWALVALGLLLMAAGFLVGAYAAFCEDTLNGMAYLVFPIYTGYYLVTRFDGLWPFFGMQTIGFVMFLLGTKSLEWSGAF